MKLLEQVSLEWFVRLFGVVCLAGAFYIIVKTSFSFGWFSGPTAALGLIAGPGMIFHRPWGRWAGILFYGVWLAFGMVFLFSGSPFRIWFPLILASLCAIPVIWKWSDRTYLEKV